MIPDGIQTREDWWGLATATVPKLEDYARQHGCTFDTERANEYLTNLDAHRLHSMFQKLWEDLPDRREIRHHPFGALCDLCSEFWVFEEDE